MGHKVEQINGSPVGGFQAILFTPDQNEPAPSMDPESQQPINGYYRAGSDNRKDGIAIGW